MNIERRTIQAPTVLLCHPDGETLRKGIEALKNDGQIISFEYLGESDEGHSYQVTMVEPVSYITITQTLTR